jgi:ABC-2 type transport system permease protein
MSDAVIYDRGYRSYDGPVGGRSTTRRAIVADGIRRILGLRRKTRRKLLPWALLSLAMLMAGIVVGLHFAAGSISAAISEGLPQYAELFDLFSRLALLFIAVTGPELIGPDRSQGVLSVYFSRPMTVGDYLGAKLMAFVSVTSLIYLVPQIALHLGLASLSADGFLAYLAGNLDVLWKIAAVSLAFIAVHGGVLAVITSYVDRTGFAAAAFLGTIIAGRNLAEVVAEASFPGARWFSLLALDDHPRYVRDWLFDSDVGGVYAPEAAGFGPWVSVAVIAVVGLGGAVWMLQRYRRLA